MAMLDMSSWRSTGTFCHVIFYHLSHVTKCPTSLDKDSEMELKACISEKNFDSEKETFLFEIYLFAT